MPDSARKTEESEVRTISVGVVVTSDQSLSFASCSTCPGPNRTPILHAKCTPVDSATEAGKATDGEVDAGVMGKVNAPSSSSSSTSFEKKLIKLSLTSYPFPSFHRQFHGISLEESGKERVTVIRGALEVPARGTRSAHLEFPAASLNPGPVSTVKSKRKTETSKDRPELLATKTNRGKTALSKVEKACKRFWENRQEKIFRDPPGSPDRLGPCMQILALNAIAPMDNQFVTIQTAGFSFDFTGLASATTIPFMDECFVSDPDRVGLERPDVFLGSQYLRGTNFMDEERI